MDFSRKLPIGIQDFSTLRTENYLYADKTNLIYNLTHSGKTYFLSRPRRFGKSLLVSTLEAYFSGKKELFTSLALSSLETNWKEYPVIKFSFSGGEFDSDEGLKDILQNTLSNFEQKYNLKTSLSTLPVRFFEALKNAYEATGEKTVVLVDEYDNPLLKASNKNREEANRIIFKSFFATLKDADEYTKFVFFTGVTKFSKVSIFSDLNQLNDISMNSEYSTLCGITQQELETIFSEEILSLSKANGITKLECLQELKRMYDGYHFSKNAEGVYNPFSLINAFREKEVRTYWFETGTPTFLIEKLKHTSFDAKTFSSNTARATDQQLSDYRSDNPNPLPLFYQSGYLTINGYDKKRQLYYLGYPNDEVKYSFIQSLSPLYLHSHSSSPLDIYTFDDYIECGNLEEIKNVFISLFARLPYSQSEEPKERDFQNVVYIVFTLLGKFCQVELHSAKGRADCVVETDNFVYIFEFKRDSSALEALKQIDEMDYAASYTADKRTVYKIGVNFNSQTRNIDGFEVRT